MTAEPMRDFLARLEAALKEFLKGRYLPEGRFKHKEWVNHDLQFFARGADLLSTAFTEGRSELPKNYFNKKEFRSGFLLYFFIPTFVKVWKCLEQLPPDFKGRPLKILDLGCGPATAAIACSAFFRDQALEIFGYEQNANIRKDALHLWQKLGASNHRFRFTHVAIPREKIDITIASYFFTEIPPEKQLQLGLEALNHSKILIVIEPALQKTTRQLMTLRDKILERGMGSLLAPCTHSMRCPMLAANKRDWCHFYIEWKCPLLIRQVDQLIGNKHDYLKMAYMIFSSLRAQRSNPVGVWRVVSSPLISAGKKEFILCGVEPETGKSQLQKITRLNKHRNAANAAFDQLKRGDLLEWDSTTPPQLFRIIKSSDDRHG